ncbi:TIGR03960 family B12-binding radical SAM protein, partial [bacterium]
ERTGQHPLVIAGGHACYNPEPMADFIDAFVIGEGEEVFGDLVNAYQAWKRSGQARAELLVTLSGIPGVYVPALYRPHYQPEGTLERMECLHLSAPAKITKRMLAMLPPAPTRFLVPNIEVVHNRISVEIMRGCTRGCRFCHAGMITRPVRERSIEEIVDTLQTALDSTGFEEIALLSLSSSDYSHITDLVDAVTTRFAGRNLTISLPSLRIDSFSVDLMEKLKGSRQGGFTLAPEAATERMRNIINKPIPTQQLLDTARAIYSRGWLTLKLYFMIGHPDETLEDVQAIADLCKAVLAEGRKAIGGRAQLHAGVSTFVPKAHTPFQWVPADSTEQIEAKQALLRRELRGPNLKLNWSDPRDTMLEAYLSRGDRRLGAVILGAWQRGAKFDAWQDQVKHDAWQEAFAAAGLSPDFYVHRTRFVDEVFPWDHIDTAVKKTYLLEEYRNSQQGILRGDCRKQCYACGILPTFAGVRRLHQGDYWKCPEVTRRTAPALAD